MDELGEWLPNDFEQPSLAAQGDPQKPIVLDFGSAVTRVGTADAPRPQHTFMTRAARFRDRKTGETRTRTGNDILLDPASRSSARSPFDGPLIVNWDPAEQILDYSLDLIGFDVDRPSPLAVSEALLLPQLPHRTMQEMLFEGYAAPRVLFAADVLTAAHHLESTASAAGPASTKDFLLVFLGAEASHVVPVLGGKVVLADTRRIRFGGHTAIEFLHQLLVLKYPSFPVPVSMGEVEQMMRRHCYVAEDYREAVRSLASLDVLSAMEVRVQAPPPTEPVRDIEREERQAARRQENGRRLQEQAAIAREKRDQQRQDELDELRAFEKRIASTASAAASTNDNDENGEGESEGSAGERAGSAPMDFGAVSEEAQHELQASGFRNLAQLQRTIRQLDVALQRARGQTVDVPEPETPLLSIPDGELTPDQIKEKRRQRLLRASYDARQRARAAKEAQLQAEEAAQAAEAEWRERDLRGWASAKRADLDELLTVLKKRAEVRGNARMRFRLAADGEEETLPKLKRKRPNAPPPVPSAAAVKDEVKEETKPQDGGEPLPQEVGLSGETAAPELPATAPAPAEFDEELDEVEDEAEVEERYQAEAEHLKALLLEYDPEFSLETLEPQRSWTQSTAHKFLWGARPYDAEDIVQNYQLNLSIERIRTIEPLFQPSMVGLDQAGLAEVCSDLLRKYPQLAGSVRLSGGLARVKGLAARLQRELRRDLPIDVNVAVDASKDPEIDAWRGLAEISLDESRYVTRKEYEEEGPDFCKSHEYI